MNSGGGSPPELPPDDGGDSHPVSPPSTSPRGDGTVEPGSGATFGSGPVPLAGGEPAAAWVERARAWASAKRAADQARVDREFRRITAPENYDQRMLPRIRWKR